MAFLLRRRFFKCRSDIKRVVTATQPYCSSVVSGKKHVNGVDLYYEQIGRGKHAVLLFPGALGCSQTHFGPQRESLSKERFTVVAWDPRGYGRSRPPTRDFPPDFFERDAQDGVDLMKALGFDRFSLLGWSAGGTSALIAAAKNPDVIHQMVVLGAGIRHSILLSLPSSLKEYFIATYGREGSIRTWGAFLDACNKFAERPQDGLIALPHRRKTVISWGAVDPGTYRFMSQSDGLRTKGLMSYQGICPTLIVNGDNDDICPLYQAECLFKHIKGSRFHLFPGGSHFIHLTHSDEVNKLVEDFLED